MTTTREQDAVIEALAVEHGATKVLPYIGAVLACGWCADEDGGHRVTPWLFVNHDGAKFPATWREIAHALELADRQAAQVATA